MCGVFAITGESNNSGDIVLEGLKKLEYRGYDSWGIAVKGEKTIKGVGKISDVSMKFPSGNTSIGHTRWATHGAVTKKNAHPHTQGRVTLVHNGIAENYLEIKKGLPKKYRMVSETDSEILAALIDSLLKKDPKSALRKASKMIEGRFALVVMIEGFSGIWIVRRGSPLIIGRGKKETYVASDIPAFLKHTNVVNYLDDGELAHINGGSVEVFNIETGKPVKKRNIVVDWDQEQATKDGWPHFMIKEIIEQKETILNTLNHKSSVVEKFVNSMKKKKGSYMIGSGTAHKAAMFGEYLFAEVANRKINVVRSEEMKVFERFIKKGTSIVAISQSGETADALEVLEYGVKNGAKILSITNTPSSSIARMSDQHICINTGIEKAVASTKAMTAQMALLLLCAYSDGPGISYGRRILQETGANINDMLNPRYSKHIEKIAKKISKEENMFIIGRNSLYPMALEAAIKIQEVSYIHAQGFAAGELKHGPIALNQKGTICVVLGDDTQTLTNAIELKARGAKILGISPTNPDVFDYWIRVPDCGTAQAIATVIPTQLLAYYLAISRGVNPDMPRNLAKSVTVK
ncbi:glutamine--fructose-6-phosphate transaminase (isomerizing) [Candidatus Kaiserbacteria bacterium]|nr:MAG: glutamine--fructose-6-phosphate transaminase (isomerizing) [Candidatus Kaiserbacteria bacterium]